MMLDKPIAKNSISSFWFPTLLRTRTQLILGLCHCATTQFIASGSQQCWKPEPNYYVITPQLNLLLLVSNTVENNN